MVEVKLSLWNDDLPALEARLKEYRASLVKEMTVSDESPAVKSATTTYWVIGTLLKSIEAQRQSLKEANKR